MKDFAAVAAKIVTDKNMALLKDRGYFIVDNAFGAEWAQAFHNELAWLMEHKMMKPNQLQFQTSSGPVIFDKPNIYEV
jgi:hypothetical protein